MGKKAANPWGVYDLHGNVAEFCRDGYLKDLFERAARPDDAAITDTTIARGLTGDGDRFSLRGGSWDSSARALRAAFRADVPPDSHNATNGFRLVIDGADPPEWARAAFAGSDPAERPVEE